MAELLERHFEGRQAPDDVEFACVPQVADPEDLSFERTLTGCEYAAEVTADRIADGVGVGGIRRSDRRYGPVVLEAFAEQIQAKRLRALFHRAREPLVTLEGG